VSRHFPDWLKAYTQFTITSEAPAALHFWVGVSMVAGAVRRRVWIDERIFKITPNFYIVLVAPPGVATKSTTIRIGTNLLREVPGIKFGPQSMTWESMLDAFAAAVEVLELNATTTVPMSCLTFPVTELGTFLRTDDPHFVNFITGIWDGQDEPWDRRTRKDGETSIKNPWVNLIGATTPDWIKNSFSESMIGGGLASRILFVYADKKAKLIAYPSDIELPEDYDQTKKKLIEDLIRISMLKGEYKLAPDAKQWGREWYHDLWTNRPQHMASDKYNVYLARKQTHLHKLALILTIARAEEPIVQLQAMRDADVMLKGVEHDMAKVFESVGAADSAIKLNTIMGYLTTYKNGVSNQDLWRMCINYMDQRTYQDAIRAGIEARLLEVVAWNGKQYIRRRSVVVEDEVPGEKDIA
jgi:hypothetical protein